MKAYRRRLLGPRGSIGARLMVSFLLVMLLPVAAVNLVSAGSAFQTGRIQALEQLVSVATLKQIEMEGWRMQLVNGLRALSLRGGGLPMRELKALLLAEKGLDGSVENSLRDRFWEEIRLSGLFEEIFLIGREGKVLLSTQVDNENKWVTNQDYFPASFRSEYVSPPFYAIHQGKMSIVAATVVSGDGVLGSLIGRASLAVCERILAERGGLGSTGETYLVGANHALLTPTRFGSGDFIRTEGVSRAIGERKSGSGSYIGYRDRPVLGAWIWLESLQIALVAERDQDEAFGPILSTLLINLLLVSVFVLLASVLSLVITRSLIRPLASLAATAGRIADGTFEERAAEEGDHEIATLGRSFNRMTDRLRALIADLETQVRDRLKAEKELTAYKDHLEELVARRTGELQVARIRAEESDRLKSTFLATMSHELRTPLNSIIGFTGILIQGLVGPLNEEQKKQLGFVMESSRHLLALISDILDISKIEAGELTIESAPFDLASMVRGTLASLEPMANKKGLELTALIDPQAGWVVGDSRRLGQVLLNLAGNAVKFTERGSVRVECACQDQEIRFDVADTGSGISREDREKLFRPFQQLDSGLNRMHEGTGLGLSICKKLLELMGGRIEVQSSPGKGSVFTFRIPLRRSAS